MPTKILPRVVTFCFLFFISSGSQAAQVFIDFNGYYAADSFKLVETSNESKMLMDFAFGFALDRNAQYQIGWNYSMMGATSPVTGGSDTYSSTEMGPKFSYYFSKHRTWGASLTYNLIVNGSYTPQGGSARKWRGSSLRFDIGYAIPIDEFFRLGLRMVYNSTSFNEEVDEPTLTSVSFNRSFIYPALHMSYLF
jgi:hypothetical protein